MKNMIKDFFSKKKKLIITVVILIVIVMSIILYFVFRKDEKFVLNPIYDVYPEEVKALYSNMVEVSCYGDWFLNIKIDNEKKVNMSDIDSNILIDYVFSYLDKKDLLKDEFKVNVFEDTIDLLYAEEIDLIDLINGYSYGGYIYTIRFDTVTREEVECVSSMNYVSQLTGYSFNEDLLSVDVNIGYLKDGILYDMNDSKLGEYDGNPENIKGMLDSSPYYRFNYVKINGDYKLDSVEFNIRY